MLTEALRRAQAGEIQEAMVVAVCDDGEAWIAYSASLDPLRRIGLLETAKSDYVNEWLDGSEEA